MVSRISALLACSSSQARPSLSAIGCAKALAITAPYNVVSSATAIAGPIAAGSDMLASICTRPISVPIIPIAGPIVDRYDRRAVLLATGEEIDRPQLALDQAKEDAGVKLDTTWKPYRLNFLAEKDDENARITFTELTPGKVELAGVDF